MSDSAITSFTSPRTDLSILLLGAGGREHALAYKLAQSERVAKIYVSPGNGGTADMGGKVRNVDVKWGGGGGDGAQGFDGLVAWAKENEVDLLVPGPEQPLVDGVEGVFRRGESSG